MHKKLILLTLLLIASNLFAKDIYIKVMSVHQNNLFNALYDIQTLGYPSYTIKYREFQRVYAGPFQNINDASIALDVIQNNLSSDAFIVNLSTPKANNTKETIEPINKQPILINDYVTDIPAQEVNFEELTPYDDTYEKNTPLLTEKNYDNTRLNGTFKINLGAMYVTNYDTKVQMGTKNIPLDATIDAKENLGMKNDTSVFRLDGLYRFSDKHSIDFSYYRVRSYGNQALKKSIEWDGITLEAGAAIESHFNMDIYKLNYCYSFYQNDEIELALSAGLHVSYIDLGLKAIAGVDSNISSSSNSYNSKEDIPIPLPVIGFKGEYEILYRKLFVNYRAEVFYLKYEDYKGSFISNAINFEYYLINNIGVGVGYNTNKILAKGNDSNNRFELENDLSGILFYVTYIY
jgi:hypothetical protein